MNTAVARKTRARQSREQSRARIIAAAAALVRDRSFAELSVGEVMDMAGIGRTLFYRHFDDLGDLLLKASREAIEELYVAEVGLASGGALSAEDTVLAAIEPAVAAYSRHGPLLRALSEAATSDPEIAAAQETIRHRFDELVADSLAAIPALSARPRAEIEDTARALNLLNTSYLLDAFGHEPRVAVETAVRTLSEIWLGVAKRGS
ncbi:MAG: TetR/AcrR family transcriptional regulator [Solirubrobacterales bacterium]